ncbi:MAG: hypothetical protein ACTS7I_03155 [Candidatus Hodgkinia cicadicola]
MTRRMFGRMNVRAGALASRWQMPPMPQASMATNSLQTVKLFKTICSMRNLMWPRVPLIV